MPGIEGIRRSSTFIAKLQSVSAGGTQSSEIMTGTLPASSVSYKRMDEHPIPLGHKIKWLSAKLWA